jgi:hypothetical protein
MGPGQNNVVHYNTLKPLATLIIETTSHFNNVYIFFIYCVLFYCILVCRSDIARPTIYIFNSFTLCMLDITALLELETQAFRYTCNNIC